MEFTEEEVNILRDIIYEWESEGFLRQSSRSPELIDLFSKLGLEHLLNS